MRIESLKLEGIWYQCANALIPEYELAINEPAVICRYLYLLGNIAPKLI